MLYTVKGDDIDDELVTKKKLKSGDPQVTRKAIIRIFWKWSCVLKYLLVQNPTVLQNSFKARKENAQIHK